MAPTTSHIGVCSWSLQPVSPKDLVQKLMSTGLPCVQLALAPLRRGEWDVEETEQRLSDEGLGVVSGMMSMAGEDYSTLDSIRITGGLRPDAHWKSNLVSAGECARLASRLKLDLISFHAGFLPHDRSDPEREVLLDRLRKVVDVFAEEGVHVALETGQETADTLLDVLADIDRPTAGVNFDPANMLLYGMGDPVLSLDRLARHVKQIHVKDAHRSAQPGSWGEEVPVGTGEVDWKAFFELVSERLPGVNLLIEREAGADRIGDVRTASALLGNHGFHDRSTP
ncbi:MAG: sugar phosphate isomerase/epimerase [Planctomycetota bacterium]|nr:sugar phosphate isomerase/epimerase [Planctomycetota bacterium]